MNELEKYIEEKKNSFHTSFDEFNINKEEVIKLFEDHRLNDEIKMTSSNNGYMALTDYLFKTIEENYRESNNNVIAIDISSFITSNTLSDFYNTVKKKYSITKREAFHILILDNEIIDFSIDLIKKIFKLEPIDNKQYSYETWTIRYEDIQKKMSSELNIEKEVD